MLGAMRRGGAAGGDVTARGLVVCVWHNTRQAKSPTRRLLRKSAPGSTRSCDPESTSICGDVGEVDP